jgi:hypothetical protein
MSAVRQKDGTIMVCGMVNAKNSFGGYTGAGPYYGMLVRAPAHPVFGVIAMGGTDIETMVVDKQCNDLGIHVY